MSGGAPGTISCCVLTNFYSVVDATHEDGGGLSCARLRVEREPDPGDQASAFAREQLEAAAVRAHHALDDGEAQARAALVAARDLKARERLLEALHLRGRDAGTAIGHVEHRRAVFG